ncbi:TetR/AcrR family transcriptional regulator [Wenzhouxiangella sp. AB-CW3]|uniref:TetR/AcrR family transcriptional regulator n=1 Tax=Wenzhouxiangella sp. AB-CW3 TaxID=2771012 RepID=UPI00168BBC90|nr:TetR/AcrR family transcriptional regulator [Wenzhouxiangella sp. AB-CW3]QOC22208.1 TetR/AcrR family transcriptional regulator [Wenzhouxiangella sp. AB-CW3]
MQNSNPSTRNGGERATLTPADWEQAALELIAEKGISGLGVEPLARRLEITKGSFYWHFPGRGELLAAALERWENQDRQHLKLSLTAEMPPAERLSQFVWRTSQQTLTHRIYLALCAAPEDPCIGPVIKRVTARRIKYLAGAFEELGLNRDSARQRANLLYSSYVGYLHLQAQNLVPEPGPDNPEFEQYIRHIIETLVEVG